MNISVSELVTLELVSLGGIGTDTGCAGCRRVEISVKGEEHTHATQPEQQRQEL